jgi:hypothetical protein
MARADACLRTLRAERIGLREARCQWSEMSVGSVPGAALDGMVGEWRGNLGRREPIDCIEDVIAL